MVGVFMSHSTADRGFARRLGNDIRGYGATVWIDEAEIRIGDSLIDKISQGIDNTDYLIVVLSRDSCASEWVRCEVNIALTREINGKTVRVLPCLLETCEIPAFLLDKKYADFREPQKYLDARSQLIKALGLEGRPSQVRFLEQHVFYDLVDLNDGFDVASIRYFGASDFQSVLDRAEAFGIEIYGIEPWPDGKFGGVRTYEEYSDDPADPAWYRAAFRDFLGEGINTHFAASYGVPQGVLGRFLK